MVICQEKWETEQLLFSGPFSSFATKQWGEFLEYFQGADFKLIKHLRTHIYGIVYMVHKDFQRLFVTLKNK